MNRQPGLNSHFHIEFRVPIKK